MDQNPDLNAWSKSALDLMPDGILFVKDDLIEYANQALPDMLHLARQDIVGRKLEELLDPADWEIAGQHMQEILDGAPEYPINIRVIGFQGKSISTQFIPRVVHVDDHEKGWICVLRDLTIENRIRAAIGEVDLKYRALVENAPDAIVVYDPQIGRFVDANEKAVWLFGLERQAIFRVGFVELSAEYEEVGEAFQEILQKRINRALIGEIVDFEWLCKAAAHGTIPCEVRMVQLPTVGRTLIRCSVVDITARKRAEDDLLHEALFDALTGLPNRNLFHDRLDASIRRALADSDFEFAVLFFDIDRFKHINDSLGHLAGDQLLAEVAKRLNGLLREQDLAARLAGDEFTILLEDIHGPDYPRQLAEKMLSVIAEPIALSGQEVRISASMGIAMSSVGYNKPENILRDADTAMYQAKSKGRARYEFFDPATHPRTVDLLQVDKDLRLALQREEFVLFYEPIVSVPDRIVTGLEAFIRWRHPERGLLRPVDFISHAEEVGLIALLDAWVLRETCRQYRLWQTAGIPPARIAVNLSAHHVHRKNTIDLIVEALQDNNMPAASLELELLESVLVNDVEYVADIMKKMKALGLRLSLDDFGAVYSSLSQLRYLPIDNLRIDQTLIRDIVDEEAARAIVQSIISLAEKLGIVVIAEGVETEAQFRLLGEWGCDEAQGFLFGPSRPAEQISELLKTGFDKT